MTASTPGRPDEAVLAEAAEAAGYAPSVHNTQPWRWRVRPHALDLYVDPGRRLGITDPEGRLAHLSCGAALHHARIALEAEGCTADVALLPDPADPGHLATLTLSGRVGVTPSAMRLFQAVLIRHTDRQPVRPEPVDRHAIDAIVGAAITEGGRLHVLHPDQVLLLASVADEAQRLEVADPDWQAELAYWAGGSRPAGTGVPDNAILDQPAQTTVPGRDFGHPGTLTGTAGHDRDAVYAILYGDDDSPAGWLRGGAALSAAWLTATILGLSVLPLSGAVEVDRTRATLRGVLAQLGHPFLVLRFGAADPDTPGAPHTPRLPAAQTVEFAQS